MCFPKLGVTARASYRICRAQWKVKTQDLIKNRECLKYKTFSFLPRSFSQFVMVLLLAVCINFPWLHNKLPPNLATSNNTHVVARSLCGSRVQECVAGCSAQGLTGFSLGVGQGWGLIWGLESTFKLMLLLEELFFQLQDSQCSFLQVQQKKSLTSIRFYRACLIRYGPPRIISLWIIDYFKLTD